MSDDYEHQTKTFEISDQITAQLAELEAQGWQLTPGTKPVAIYQLRRDRRWGAHGGVSIDESKVYVIKAGSTN